MELIISQLVQNFDFAMILNINLITYFIIKFIDELNGCKIPSLWQKRIIFVIVAIVTGVVYFKTNSVSVNVILNSCIAAPVAWSWLAKPIAKHLGIDYKQK